MSAPADLKYLESHEWHKLEGDVVTIGITQIAADELTDITYVAVVKPGTKVIAGGRFGEVESVKATSDLYSGVAGEVTAVNEALSSDPGLVNREPFAGGWMIKVRADHAADDLAKLLSADDYLKRAGH